MQTRWERAYLEFETPEQELRKFLGRLRDIGAHTWDRRCRILEVCAGRGTGLHAWHALGFRQIVGVDYSRAFVAAHRGPGYCVVGDARSLPLPSGSRDIVAVQGGLHHLATREDVDLALAEMRRVLAPRGRVVIIEPWLTPFLRLVHFVCRRPAARRFSLRINALATMIEEEQDTYDRWLTAPDEYLRLIHRYFTPRLERKRFGKIVVVGTPKES